MNNIKISIIIPIYNVEQYIDKCIESILNQTYKNFELILVNDGSTDDTFQHLVKYKNNKRITIINKSNTGQSDSRYQGLLVSEGDYVLFIDSDDTMATNALETYITHSENGTSDVVFTRYQLINEKGEVIRVQSKYSTTKYESKELILKDALCIKNFKSSLWIKMIKRDILINAFNENVRKIRINEDLLLSIFIAIRCNNVSFSNEIGYNVLQRKNSLTRNIKPEIITGIAQIFTHIKTELEINDRFKDYAQEFYYGYSKSILYSLAVCAQKALDLKHFQTLSSNLKKNDLLGNVQYKHGKASFPIIYSIMFFFVKHKRMYYFANKILSPILKY